MFAHPHVRTIVFLSELNECLFAGDVITPERVPRSIVVSCRLKLVSAGQTFVSSQTAAAAVFFGVVTAAFRAFSATFLEAM